MEITKRRLKEIITEEMSQLAATGDLTMITEAEKKVFRRAKWTTFGMALVGTTFPLGLLVSRWLRDMLVNTPRKRTCFSLLMATLGYGNYIASYSSFLNNLVQLNNSPMAYVTFQIMCQQPYRKYRNKWQTTYNLSSIAHRYEKFDFENAMRESIDS